MSAKHPPKQEHHPVVENKAISGLKSTIKIPKTDGIIEPVKKENQPVVEEPLQQIQQKDKTAVKPKIEEIKKLWKEFQQQKELQGATSEANVLNKEPEFDDEGNIRIILLKGLEEEIFRKIKIDLLHFLRHQTSCFEIDIRTEIIEEQTRRMLYTAQEKFEFLADKNPQLRELKKRLGLDLDF